MAFHGDPAKFAKLMALLHARKAASMRGPGMASMPAAPSQGQPTITQGGGPLPRTVPQEFSAR